jgi:probable rRNA maturation factor
MSAAAAANVDLQCSAGVTIPAGADVPGWVAATLAHVPGARPGGMALRLVDAGESREMNRRYRGRDAPTNVLAFPAELLPGLPPDAAALLGDLVICGPLMEQEAAAQDKTPLAHFAHLVVHGTLHLLGMDHHADADAARMEGLERQILEELGFGDPYGTETG